MQAGDLRSKYDCFDHGDRDGFVLLQATVEGSDDDGFPIFGTLNFMIASRDRQRESVWGTSIISGNIGQRMGTSGVLLQRDIASKIEGELGDLLPAKYYYNLSTGLAVILRMRWH
jgi:hypothetical protein